MGFNVAPPPKITDLEQPNLPTVLNNYHEGTWEVTNKVVQAYGEIYASDNTTETTIDTQNEWVQCTIFDTNGLYDNITPDHTNDHITIVEEGVYVVLVSASVLSGAGAAFDGEFEVKKNNGATDLLNLHTDRDLSGGGGDHGSISMTGVVNLDINDTIEVWVRNKTNTTNVIFEDITLTVIQVAK